MSLEKVLSDPSIKTVGLSDLDSNSNSVVKGKDSRGTPFINIIMKIEKVDEPVHQTFFKVNDKIWRSISSNVIQSTFQELSMIQQIFLSNIISGYKVEINSGHLPVNNDFIGRKVSIF